jgi:cytochrome P450 family 150 subfamily A5
MTDYDAIDFFRGEEFVADPYPYYDFMRSRCPVRREQHHDVMMVTGYDEALAVYHDPVVFSSCNSVTGPFPGFPVPLEGRDDVSDLIEQYRDGLPMSDQVITFDPPKHTDHRGLLMKLLTPGRLKENEAFMWDYADSQIDEFVDQGSCEFISEYASPFAMLIIADLLGVPREDHELFRRNLVRTTGLGSTGDDTLPQNPLEFLYQQLSTYVEDRRREPRQDVLSGLASATFKDGSIPEVIDVVRVAANIFAAGQETTVRLLAAAVQYLADHPDFQTRLRKERDRIPNFVEEMLRYEGPVKGDFRLARRATTVGGVEIPAGTTVMVLNAAANRDPRKFEQPDVFDPDRGNARHHVAFGHGNHVCPGAPLARTEGRVSLEKLLDRLADIRISETHHGSPEDRRYQYVPTYILRGLTRLHLEFTSAGRDAH